MRMYVVKDNGNLEVVADLKKVASRKRTRYVVTATITRDEDGAPLDIKISTTCPSGEHFNITELEKKKFNMDDQWKVAAAAVARKMQQKYPQANVTMTESLATSGRSNREELPATATAPETVPETVPNTPRGLARLKMKKEKRRGLEEEIGTELSGTQETIDDQDVGVV